MLKAKIYEKLKSLELDAKWQQFAQDWTETDDAGRARSLAHVAGRRDHFLQILDEISDEDQLHETLAIIYIQAKSEWIMINTMVNYQLFNRGVGEGEFVLRGALIASLLAEIELLIQRQDIEKITHFLAEPINRSAKAA